MNPTLIAAIVGLVLLAALGVTGKLLLDAHDKIGEQAVTIRDKQAVIDQNKHDAELSGQLATIQRQLEDSLRGVGARTTQGINNAANDDDAAASAISGVMQFRAAAQRSRSP